MCTGYISAEPQNYCNYWCEPYLIFLCLLQVVDATNTTRERRKLLFDIIQVKHKFKLFFIESICDDPTIVEANVLVGPCTTIPLDKIWVYIAGVIYLFVNISDDGMHVFFKNY